jgi:hypothetical protein
MSIISRSRIPAIRRHVNCAAFEGVEKKRRTIKRMPSDKVVYEKSKKPDPRECIPGGLTKMDTRSSTHQRKVTMVKKTVK